VTESQEHQSVDRSPAPDPRAGPRQIRRSANDRVIGGVAGGLGHYFALDPILVRIAFVLLVLAGGSGLLLYIILWIVIPQATEEEDVAVVSGARRETGGLILGGAMVVIGGLLLLQRIAPWFDSQMFWALLLVGLGAFILLRGVRR
jgi:phage shock protein C